MRPDSDAIGVLDSPLLYWSEKLDCLVTIPVGFQSDGSSVPRIPFVYIRFGGRAPREGWLHDYLYRLDASPVVPRSVADSVFKEAMTARMKPVERRIEEADTLAERLVEQCNESRPHWRDCRRAADHH